MAWLNAFQLGRREPPLEGAGVRAASREQNASRSKSEKQENAARARRTEIRYCDVIENSTDAGEAELRSASRWSRLRFSAALPRGVRENALIVERNPPVQLRTRPENRRKETEPTASRLASISNNVLVLMRDKLSASNLIR